MELLMKFRALVADESTLNLDDKSYQTWTFPSPGQPSQPYKLSPFVGQEVIVEGLIRGEHLAIQKILLLEHYIAPPPPTLHRLGTTLKPINGKRPMKWRSKWSFTHAIEPGPEEKTPYNDVLSRHPEALLRVIRFLEVEKTARYQPRDGWTCCTVFVSDVTRLMHCEICLDPKGPRKWYNRGANEMVQYIKLVATVEQGWYWVKTAQEAQDLANRGLPVVGMIARQGEPGHVVMVIPGKLNANGFPHVAQAGDICASSHYWENPAVQYIAHA
jgi:hypothetical protein